MPAERSGLGESDELSQADLVYAARSDIAERAADARFRVVGRPPNDPSRWHPEEVIDPETGAPFTGPGAWEFVARKALDGHPMGLVALDKPAGEIGYEMVVDAGEQQVYVKLRLIRSRVIGRSFHPTETGED